jgi:hypothetical protein
MPGIAGEDHVEAVEIRRRKLARAQSVDVDAVGARHAAGATVRRVADMPAAETGRIGGRVEPGARRRRPKGAFGHRRAADVAGADEQDGRSVFHGALLAGRPSSPAAPAGSRRLRAG